MSEQARRWTSLLPALGPAAWLTLAMNAAPCVGSGMTVPFLLIYLNLIRGIDLRLAGLVLAVSGLAGICSTPASGWLIDRIGPLHGLALGLVMAGLAMAGFAFVRTSAAAVLAAVVYGVAGGLTYSGLSTQLAEIVAPTDRGAVFGLRYTTANLGFGAGALVSGVVLNFHVPVTFVVIFLADCASYLLFAAGLFLLELRLAAPARERPRPLTGSGGYDAVLRDRVLVIASLLQTAFLVLALAQEDASFPVWAVQLVPSTPAVVGAAFAANIVVLVASQLFVFRLLCGRTRSGAAAADSLIFAAAWAIALAAAFLPGAPARAVALVLVLAVLGLGAALLVPTLPALINDAAPAHLRGRYNAVHNLSAQVAPLAAPALAGWTLGSGWGKPLMAGLSATCLAASGLTLLFGRMVPAVANWVPTRSPVVALASAAAIESNPVCGG